MLATNWTMYDIENHPSMHVEIRTKTLETIFIINDRAVLLDVPTDFILTEPTLTEIPVYSYIEDESKWDRETLTVIGMDIYLLVFLF